MFRAQSETGDQDQEQSCSLPPSSPSCHDPAPPDPPSSLIHKLISPGPCFFATGCSSQTGKSFVPKQRLSTWTNQELAACKTHYSGSVCHLSWNLLCENEQGDRHRQTMRECLQSSACCKTLKLAHDAQEVGLFGPGKGNWVFSWSSDKCSDTHTHTAVFMLVQV